jgi:hypothetical protein
LVLATIPRGCGNYEREYTCEADPVLQIQKYVQIMISNFLIEDPTIFFIGMCSECSPGFMCIFSDSQYEQEFLDAMQVE